MINYFNFEKRGQKWPKLSDIQSIDVPQTINSELIDAVENISTPLSGIEVSQINDAEIQTPPDTPKFTTDKE